MASGLMGFLGFGKRDKPNLTPAVLPPAQRDLYFTSDTASKGGYNLRDFAAKGIRGEGLGFDDDWLSKSANPAIAKLDASFRERTLPGISNAASSRGIGRSNLVVNEISRAEQENNRDVADLMSKFYTLNEAQKKTDQTQALNLATGLQNQEASLLNESAQASERQVGRNVAQANIKNASADAMRNQSLQAIGSLASPIMGDLYAKAFPGAQSVSGGGGVKDLFTKSGGSSGVGANLLGSLSSEDLNAYNFDDLMALYGG